MIAIYFSDAIVALWLLFVTGADGVRVPRRWVGSAGPL